MNKVINHHLYAPKSGKVIQSDGTIVNEADGINPNGSRNVSLAGNSLVEQKTNTDAAAGTLTFAEGIRFIEIYNRDTVNDGVFNVNGINITVPPNEVVEYQIGGTPRTTVTVTGSTSYIVSRLV